MKVIKKIKLHNFKRFQDFEVTFDEKVNILIGDNESGKSSLLTAIDLVLRGSISKIETISLENLFNAGAVAAFLTNGKKIEHLPTMYAEIYLNEQRNLNLNGKNNSEERVCDGLRLCCEPIDEFIKEIQEILNQEKANFPFEYYSIKFNTFSGEGYTGWRKFLRHVLIDSSQISNNYATREYIKTIYSANVTGAAEKNKHQYEYRKHKNEFKDGVLGALNAKVENYSFSIKTGSKSNLETDLTITENDIPIENKGKGRQCFIKTEFALQKNNAEQDIDALLLEEPENHLSHINMKRLIKRISESTEKQLFLTTHNNLISTRLDLRKAIMLNSSSYVPAFLRDLPEETAKFFMKAPDNNILEFILSRKVMLVEGHAEFILIEAFYKNLVGESLENSDLHIISVGGTSFKRYLDIGKMLNIKTAVIRDNDEDATANCIENYKNYKSDNINIFFEDDNEKSTFEICLYELNQGICDELFLADRRTLTVLDYMLKNKAGVAFELLDKKAKEMVAPDYIRNAIEWIRQ